MQNKISVIIITGNEEKNIRNCLESVKWADELIVVDSESSDNTVKIAKEYSDKVYIQKWLGYAKQKEYAISLAKNDWVLSLDADERVTKKLSDEILNYNFDNCRYSAFKIKRDNYFLDKKINSCGWGNDYQLRLFKKSNTKLNNRLVHEKFLVDGEVSKLNNPILHYSYKNLKEGFDKINIYSSLEAEEKYKRKGSSTFKILFCPVFAFFHHYFFRKGIKDGKHGLMISLMHSITKLQVMMKVWEIKQNKK